jgi:signal transduction histidine kinase
MHRLIAIVMLMFWAIMFGGLAHLSLTGLLNGTTNHASDLQLLVASAGSIKIMPVLLMVVASLFGWAILALLVSDHAAFREVEAYSFAAAIFLMCACAVLAFANLGAASTIPALLTAALVTCVSASRHLQIADETKASADHGRDIARRMALGAAHNSLLSRVSGRPLPGQISLHHNVMPFPGKPINGGNI